MSSNIVSLQSENTTIRRFCDNRNYFFQINSPGQTPEGVIRELVLTALFVADGPAFLIELDSPFVPIEHHEVDAFKTPLGGP